MSLQDYVVKNRSYRRFYEDHAISEEQLRGLVNLACMSGSAANLQPLKYILSVSPEKNDIIFETLSWAGYLQDWNGPVEGERPSAYVIMLLDRRIAKNCACDHGIAAQSILLGAVEQGLGGCIFGNIKRDQLSAELGIDDHFEILQIIALGKPKEDVRIVPVGEDGSIRYYRDENGVHYVPKRSLEDVIVA